MPDCVDTFETEFGYDENSKSKVLPEAGRVGTFTCWVNEESSRTCSSLVCCAAVLGLVTYYFRLPSNITKIDVPSHDNIGIVNFGVKYFIDGVLDLINNIGRGIWWYITSS